VSEEIIFTVPPQAPVGTYPGVITNVSVEAIETAEGVKDLVRWQATITDEHGQDYPVDALSSLNFGGRAKARKWCTALGVTAEKVSRDMLVGKPALFVIGEDDDGYSKLLDIIAPLKSAAK
jgi:hypothetical protein